MTRRIGIHIRILCKICHSTTIDIDNIYLPCYDPPFLTGKNSVPIWRKNRVPVKATLSVNEQSYSVSHLQQTNGNILLLPAGFRRSNIAHQGDIKRILFSSTFRTFCIPLPSAWLEIHNWLLIFVIGSIDN